MRIVPGILTDDVEELNRRLGLIGEGVKHGYKIEWVQIDFIDGVYADNRTIRPKDLRFRIEDLRSNGLKFEAHLMVTKENLDEWMEECSLVGFDRIMPQVESVDDQSEFVRTVKDEWGLEAGLSIDAGTQVSFIKKEIYEKLDVVQVMMIQAGFSGQKMKEETIGKVGDVLTIRNGLGVDFLIEVDGGVKLDNIELMKRIKVDLAEVNSGLFGTTVERRKGKSAKELFEENLDAFYELMG